MRSHVIVFIVGLALCPYAGIAGQAQAQTKNAERITTGEHKSYLGFQVDAVTFQRCDGSKMQIGGAKIEQTKEACPPSNATPPPILRPHGVIVGTIKELNPNATFVVQTDQGAKETWFVPVSKRKDIDITKFKLNDKVKLTGVTTVAGDGSTVIRVDKVQSED